MTVKFEKNSQEYNFFGDYYKIVISIVDFYNKYYREEKNNSNNNVFVKGLIESLSMLKDCDNSNEFKAFFTDFYLFAQKYWLAEDNDDYWSNMTDDMNALADKYKNAKNYEFIKYILMNLLDKSESYVKLQNNIL